MENPLNPNDRISIRWLLIFTNSLVLQSMLLTTECAKVYYKKHRALKIAEKCLQSNFIVTKKIKSPNKSIHLESQQNNIVSMLQ